MNKIFEKKLATLASNFCTFQSNLFFRRGLLKPETTFEFEFLTRPRLQERSFLRGVIMSNLTCDDLMTDFDAMGSDSFQVRSFQKATFYINASQMLTYYHLQKKLLQDTSRAYVHQNNASGNN